MIWQDWVESAAAIMGVTTTQAGVILGFFIILVLIVILIIGQRGRQVDKTVPYVALFSVILFTYIGWFPLVLGTLIGIVISILIAGRISKALGD